MYQPTPSLVAFNGAATRPLGYTRQTHNVCLFLQSQEGVSSLLLLSCLVPFLFRLPLLFS